MKNSIYAVAIHLLCWSSKIECKFCKNYYYDKETVYIFLWFAFLENIYNNYVGNNASSGTLFA
jgi:hypothetical protein